MSYVNMNLKTFIENIITYDNVDNILDNCKTSIEKGFVFERLFDIVIKFGFCDIFDNSKFDHLIGNSNNGRLRILKNINRYLTIEKVYSGNSSGCSDITLRNKDDKTYIFISSKFSKSPLDIRKQKLVNYYDIQNIIAMATNNVHIYKKYKIYLVVPNTKDILDKVKNANKSSKYITKYMNEDNILDKNDLNKYFLRFKFDIIKNKKNNWNELYLNKRENLKLRFHQELIIQKTNNLILKGNKSFLWGCKCRSGKTYMVGGIINKQFSIKKQLNVLIITPAPTETISQFTNDLFDKFKDFDIFKIHNINGSKQIQLIETSNNNIFILSKQLLQKYITDKTIIKIKDLKLDIIIFDENHFSGTTNLSKLILDSYSSKNTIKIYLTATYKKPLDVWNILPECQMYWDIEDEQICKSILINIKNLNKLKKKHGIENIKSTIVNYSNFGYSLKDMFIPYQKMPDLHLITNMFDNDRYDIIKENIMGSNYGFSFDTLFSLNKNKGFNYRREIKIILRYITGSEKEIDYKNEDKSILTRINKICLRPPFTQIWFLPSDNINYISQNLKMLMLEDKILKNYNIMCINRKNTDLVKNIKDEISKQEMITKSEGKDGLILLAGNMLNIGITIESCDIVMLMNNTLSSDKIMQQMYRCMTEGINKNAGFVVDLNISRVLQTCVNYNINKKDNIEDKIKYLIKHHLINIDIDMLENKEINSDTIINKLLNIWKNDPVNSFKILLRRLDNDYDEFDNSTQQLLNKHFTKSLISNRINAVIEISDIELPSGKEKIIDNSEIDIDDTSEKDNIDKIRISFTKDVLPYIIPLTCILTLKNSNMDFVKMLNDIKGNPELLEIFDDQCLIWWNKKNLINLIKHIITRYFDKRSNTYNISIQFKMSLQSLIDKPKELLELINDCLKPKENEKKKYGEVFTPISLVNDMLDKLPMDIWKNKNLKWYDPASGMGNFPIAVYLRLMKTLKGEILNKKERKKHILENMLYMSELNKKNVLITKQIFDIKNEYKLNIYCGDSLILDINSEWNIENFDIIMGNPPYQDDSGNKGKGHTLWTKFLELSLNKLLNLNGYLVYVHPSLWRQIDNPYLKLIKNKQLLYLEIHNSDDGMKTFRCATRYDWYVLCNTLYANPSIIKGEDGIINKINLNEWPFIPNKLFNEIKKLITNNKINLDVNNYRSNYGADKKWISKVRNNEFKYPVIYSINKNNQLSLRYSNTNKNGHFGLSKFIFSNGAGFFCDTNGEYGLTQWAYCIYDIKDNLIKINDAFRTNEFNDIKNAIQLDSSSYNIKVMKLFKKDFYKDFIKN